MWEVMTNMESVVSYSTGTFPSWLYNLSSSNHELSWFSWFSFPACGSERVWACLVSTGRALASGPRGQCLSPLCSSQTIYHQYFHMGGSMCSDQESTHSGSDHLCAAVGFTAHCLWSMASLTSLFLSLAFSQMKMMTLSFHKVVVNI